MLLISLLACQGAYKGPIQVTPLYAGGASPDRGHLVVELLDQQGQGVGDWQPGEIALSIDDGSREHALRTWADQDAQQPVLMLLDLSDSVEDADGLEALKEFGLAVVGGMEPGQPLELVGYSELNEVLLTSTGNRFSRQAVWEDLIDLGSVSNTNGALVDALERWEDDLSPEQGGTRGVLVLVTDGGDGPDDTTISEVIEARGDKAVIVVEVNTSRTDLDQVATHGHFEIDSYAELPALADQVLDRMERGRSGLVFATWCGSSGTVELTFTRERLKGAWYGTAVVDGSDTVAWGRTSSLPEPMQTHHARILDGWMYTSGGDEDGSVLYTRVLEDGRLGSWREGWSIDAGEETRLHAAEGRLWAINGTEAWQSWIDEDGLNGEWEGIESPGYSNVIRDHEGSLYSITRDRVYLADITDAGLGSWSSSEDFPAPLDGGYVGGAFAGGELVVVGSQRASGESWRTVGYRASVSSDGSLGSWAEVAFGPFMGLWLNVDSDGQYVYVFPGDDGDTSDVLSARPGESWSTAGALSQARRWYATAASEGYVYLHGGDISGEGDEGALYTMAVDGRLELSCIE
jgi:hypothetical protein